MHYSGRLFKIPPLKTFVYRKVSFESPIPRTVKGGGALLPCSAPSSSNNLIQPSGPSLYHNPFRLS